MKIVIFFEKKSLSESKYKFLEQEKVNFIILANVDQKPCPFWKITGRYGIGTLKNTKRHVGRW